VVRRLLELGDGVAANELLQETFEKIAEDPDAEVAVDGPSRRWHGDSDKWTWQPAEGSLQCKGQNGTDDVTVLALPAAPWLSRVTMLDISSNSLTTLPEAFFGLLPSLEQLDLSRNCLWELSPSVGLLKSLTSLSLYSRL